jgi:signal transduction histidine kinase
MGQVDQPSQKSSHHVPAILAALSFFYLTVILRTLAEAQAIGSRMPVYLGLEILFGMLLCLTLWKPVRRGAWRHLYFLFQSLLTLYLLVQNANLDFINIFFVLLSYQVADFFKNRLRWSWVGILLLLIVVPLGVLLGIPGIALSLLPVTVAIIFQAFGEVSRQMQKNQLARKALLARLQDANAQLTQYAGQVEEIAAVQERNRLARELHDSVSQTLFSIGLHSRSARLLQARDRARLPGELEQLQKLSQAALDDMRSLIAGLHPKGSGTGQSPTT